MSVEGGRIRKIAASERGDIDMAVRVQSVAKKVNLGESATIASEWQVSKSRKKRKQQKAGRKLKEWRKVEIKANRPLVEGVQDTKSPGLKWLGKKESQLVESIL